jgi:hypothetical protein
MSLDRAMFALGGFMVMLTVLLGFMHHEYWFYFTAFVGFNMFQSAFTGFCPPVFLLKKFGVKPGEAFK